MLFNKPIHEITFEDVVKFCEKMVPEGKQLDYKYFLPKNNEKFAKSIASFANAMGGTIIIGVKDDKNDSPTPPFTGIPFQYKIRNKIEDIIQTYIDPVVFVDINVCGNSHGQMFVVVNIPQSNLTPHLVGKMKRAYIRTGQSSRPEIIVHPDKLPWLLDHRKKSEALRHILLDKAGKHFDNYIKSLSLRSDSQKAVLAVSLIPMYPQEPLLDYHDLRPVMEGLFPGGQTKTVQDGITKLGDKDISMLELNSYGLIYFKKVLVPNADNAVLNFADLEQDIRVFFKTATNFNRHIAFGGPLSFRFTITNARGVEVFYNDKRASVLEDFIRTDCIYTSSKIELDMDNISEQILNKTAWALDIGK
ncbi:Putative transcriptional regulator [Elusimicrobium minutum Pei191]|uniref:Putative transcriptional regulator n=1 Tax=Elusimicrobium minutum (strain Pei191) TaxID=445932 RepID=B2KCJ1_ELUMP|nr:ATP-binding protein [Elusimicrobium minutum]ACC98112.1 Putative transcriptional regulator [Elusimicrobium minutum Pei191]